MPTSEQKTYSTFCVLWGLATLFHLVAKDPWPAPLLSTFLAVAALFLLHRPSEPHRLALLAALQMCESWTTAPFISNHWLFTGLVNLTLLQAYARLAWAGRTFAVEPGTLYRTFAPIVRLELLILYFFAVFHKLNADFLDPQTSCAVHFYAAQLQSLPFALAGAVPIYLTLAIEAAIPLLLCWAPSRNAGILLGLLFHAAVGFNPISEFYNFSSMIFALLFLFASLRLDASWPTRRLFESARWKDMPFFGKKLSETPPWVALRRARDHIPSFPHKRESKGSLAQHKSGQGTPSFPRKRESSGRGLNTKDGTQGFQTAAKSFLTVGAVLVGLILLVALNDLIATPAELVLPLWGLYSAGLILLFVLLPKSPPARPAFSFRPWPVLLVPLLTVLNGCSPYLGLKTETAFAMYSNLRTEGGQSNHLLVPARVQLFGFQRDLIEIKDSSSGFLASLARRKLMLPFFEVRALLQQHPTTSLTYERHTGSSTSPSAQLRQPIPWPLRKLLYFRPVASSGQQPCFH